MFRLREMQRISTSSQSNAARGQTRQQVYLHVGEGSADGLLRLHGCLVLPQRGGHSIQHSFELRLHLIERAVDQLEQCREDVVVLFRVKVCNNSTVKFPAEDATRRRDTYTEADPQ